MRVCFCACVRVRARAHARSRARVRVRVFCARVCMCVCVCLSRVHPALLVLVALVLVVLEVVLGFVEAGRGYRQASDEVGGLARECLCETESRYAALTCKPTFGRSVSVNGSISNYSCYHSDKVHTCG